MIGNLELHKEFNFNECTVNVSVSATCFEIPVTSLELIFGKRFFLRCLFSGGLNQDESSVKGKRQHPWKLLQKLCLCYKCFIMDVLQGPAYASDEWKEQLQTEPPFLNKDIV